MRLRPLLFFSVMAVGLVPILLAALVADRTLDDTLTEGSLEQLDSMGAAQVRAVEGVADERADFLALTASRTQMRIDARTIQETNDAEAKERINRILGDARQSIPAFQQLFVHGVNGTVIGATDDARIGTLGHETAFEAGLDAVRVDLFDRDPVPVNLLAAPLRLDGALVGVLVAEASMTAYNDVAATRDGLGATGETLIAVPDDAGALFLTPLLFDRSAALTRTVHFSETDVPVVRAMLGESGETIDATDYRGEAVFASIHQLDNGWAVVVKQDRSEILSPLSTLRWGLGVLVTGAIAIMVLGTFAFSNLVSKPITRVERLAADLRAGNLDANPPRSEGPLVPDEVRELETSMADLSRRLRAAVETRQRLLRTAAHELNTPLTPLVLSIQGLKSSIKTLDSEALAASVARLERNVERLQRICKNVTEALRLDVERIELSLHEFELTGSLQHAIADHQPQADDNGVALELDAPTPAPLRADPDRVRNILDAYIGNALRFTPKGGTVRVRLLDEGDSYRVEVEDTGIGYDPSDSEGLFKPFFSTKVAEDKGLNQSGLGLSVAKALAEFHGGRVGSQSTGLDKGAVFWVSLPKHAKDQ